MNTRLFFSRLLSVFVLLSVLFSSTYCAFASTDTLFVDEQSGADEVFFENINTTNGEYKVQYMHQYGTYSGTTFNSKVTTTNYTLPSNELLFASATKIRSSASSENPMAYVMRDQYVIYPMGNVKMASKGSSLTVSLDNICQSMIGLDANGNVGRYSYFNPNGIKWVQYIIYDKDHNGYILETDTSDFNVKADGLYLTIGAEFNDLPMDVYAVDILVVYTANVAFDNNNGDDEATGTNWNYTTIKHGWGYEDSLLTINVDDNTSSLLSSIIGFIQSILEGVTNIFSKIGDFMTSVANNFSSLFTKLGTWFGNLIESIIELPSKLWTLIENGLKNLFVPDEEYITDYKNDWDNLLSNRFGVLYQSFEIIVDYVDRVSTAISTNTIEMPEVSIDLPEGEKFTFGGYHILLIPEGFEFLANAVKFVIDVIVTLGFINAMKNRFDRLMVRG